MPNRATRGGSRALAPIPFGVVRRRTMFGVPPEFLRSSTFVGSANHPGKNPGWFAEHGRRTTPEKNRGGSSNHPDGTTLEKYNKIKYFNENL